MEVLNKILDNQNSMSEDIHSMKNDISSLQKDVGSMKSNISSLQNDVTDLHSKVTTNTLILESTRKDIQVLVEVQKSHYEQNQREHQEMLTTVTSRGDIIELAVKKMSTSIGEIQEDNESLNGILGRHALSIETMRRKIAKTL